MTQITQASQAWRIALFVIAGWLAGPGALQAEGLSKESAADFEWFGTLGYPDLRGRPVASVKQERPFDAFLLRREEDGKFAVLTPELATSEYEASVGMRSGP